MCAVYHNIDPVYDSNSTILILGSFPSVKSREGQFFYHHPRNRFWKVLAAIMNAPVPETVEEKRNFLLSHGIAVWDVIASCEIHGSSDSSIRNAAPNDLSRILRSSSVRQIYCNGGTAAGLYRKYCLKQTGIKARQLPSTSPANAAFSLQHLIAEWSIIKEIQPITTGENQEQRSIIKNE